MAELILALATLAGLAASAGLTALLYRDEKAYEAALDAPPDASWPPLSQPPAFRG